MAELESTAAQEAWRKIVTRAWADEKFKRTLIDNPNRVLAENGFPPKAGVNVVIVENEPSRVHLVLPARPGLEAEVKAPSAKTLSTYDAAFT